MKKFLLKFSLTCIIFWSSFSTVFANSERKIVIGEGDWDSNAFHDQIVTYILDKGYGKTPDIVTADTAVMISGMKGKTMDFCLEMWSDNVPSYKDDIEKGVYKELSINYDDNRQGIYLPSYLIEEGGLAEGLKSVKDLKDYAHLFKDPEDTKKGIVYAGPEGWKATEFLHKKFKEYGLDEYYNFKSIDSTSTLSATLTSAYEKEEAWVGYNWEPTWIMGMYDMTLLEDEDYSKENYEKGLGAFPQVKVTVVATPKFVEDFPEIADFLSKYKTSSTLTSQGLAYMQENQVEADEAAKWFLKEHKELLDEWLPKDIAKKVKADLEGKKIEEKSNPFISFPQSLRLEISGPIDSGVNWLMLNLDGFFSAISKIILTIFDGVNFLLRLVPWWLLLISLFFASAKLYNIKTGLGLSLMLFIIGLFGLWDMMIYTLTIVAISVLVSIVLGIPMGIMMAKSPRNKKIMMPLLDGMQTMPSFVYLIPAVMFFGFGKVPAVIATTTYALPPLIRLTYLGISNINKEIIEAGLSFGSTPKQMLRKIELPQALPTIMTGINQTTMMAMAMVVISSMIGAEGIGNEVLISIRRLKIGNGFEAGLAIVFLAIILDRLLQGFAKNLKEKE